MKVVKLFHFIPQHLNISWFKTSVGFNFVKSMNYCIITEPPSLLHDISDWPRLTREQLGKKKSSYENELWFISPRSCCSHCGAGKTRCSTRGARFKHKAWTSGTKPSRLSVLPQQDLPNNDRLRQTMLDFHLTHIRHGQSSPCDNTLRLSRLGREAGPSGGAMGIHRDTADSSSFS